MLSLSYQSIPKNIEVPENFSDLRTLAQNAYPELELFYIEYESSGEAYLIEDDESFSMIKNVVLNYRTDVNLRLVGASKTEAFQPQDEINKLARKERFVKKMEKLSKKLNEKAKAIEEKVDQKVNELSPRQKEIIDKARAINNRIVSKTLELQQKIEIKFSELGKKIESKFDNFTKSLKI